MIAQDAAESSPPCPNCGMRSYRGHFICKGCWARRLPPRGSGMSSETIYTMERAGCFVQLGGEDGSGLPIGQWSVRSKHYDTRAEDLIYERPVPAGVFGAWWPPVGIDYREFQIESSRSRMQGAIDWDKNGRKWDAESPTTKRARMAKYPPQDIPEDKFLFAGQVTDTGYAIRLAYVEGKADPYAFDPRLMNGKVVLKHEQNFMNVLAGPNYIDTPHGRMLRPLDGAPPHLHSQMITPEYSRWVEAVDAADHPRDTIRSRYLTAPSSSWNTSNNTFTSATSTRSSKKHSANDNPFALSSSSRSKRR